MTTRIIVDSTADLVPEIKERIKEFNKKENDEKQKGIQKKKQIRWER